MQDETTEVRGPQANPTIALGFGLAAIAFLSMGARAFDADSGRELDPDTIAFAAYSTAAAVASLAFCGAFALPRRIGDSLGLHRPQASLGTLFLFTGGLLGLSIISKALILSSGAYDGSGLEMLDAALDPEDAGSLWVLFSSVALAAGTAEELLFRGLVLGVLLDRMGSGAAVVISALLFGAFHIDPVHIAGALPLGLYLGAVRVVTGSTLAAIFCHVANNAVAIALTNPDNSLAGAVVVAGALSLPPAGFWLVRHWPKRDAESDSSVASPETGG